MLIGVLALQGDFAKHGEVLRSLGIQVQEVRTSSELGRCDGLIIPGGESTVILRHIEFIQMRQPLLSFAKNKPVFGTCAGLILMSHSIQSSDLEPLNLLNIEVERNAFGRQTESFQSFVSLELNANHAKRVPAFFIRAPRIRKWGKEVQILAQRENEPILVRQGDCLGATFHPELTAEPDVHLYFIEMVQKRGRCASS
ncbi:MAG: pyridoxal 5'-phosphate synthase glutaminase subunit PdxT [Parachlamydiaceae bacterium]